MEKKVMIVDDDPYILIAVQALFEPEDFKVYAVSSGKECLSELEKGFKGVILMDVMMPHMDGWATIREIVEKGYNKGNIISMLTARDEPGEKVDDLKEYVLDYIRKPFESDDLINTVKEYFSYLT